jgi:tetratricopeptide (TPR) repeat protein
LLLLPLLLTLTSTSPAQQWFAVQTEHLTSYSEDERGAREAALRGERIIAVYKEIFHRKDLTFATPLRVMATHATVSNAATLSTLTRTPIARYVKADLSQPEPWTEAARSIATLTLEDNYPRAQPWFDHGIASYLAGIRFSGEQMELGVPPTGMVMPQAADWIPMAKLTAGDPAQLPASQVGAFEAESWALVRWLIDSSQLAQAGAYLNAVQGRGATPERALAETFSISPADLDREVRESLGKLVTRKMPAPKVESGLFQSRKVSTADVYALKADLSLFGPDGERTLKELVAFMQQNQQSAVVHRSLAWAFLQRHDLDNAVEHIRRSLELDDSDATMHYLYARWVNQGDENTIHFESAEVRMGAELHEALRRDPNYAAALELLGVAQLSDKAVKPALANLQRASGLRPRNDRYYLNLARAFDATGNQEAARNLMLYARAGNDSAVTAEAGLLLNELDKQGKLARQWQAGGRQPEAVAKPSKYDNLQEAIAEDEAAEARSKSASAAPDKRKVEYMKGRIVGVACPSTAGATLTVESAGREWKIDVADRNNATLIGVERFDCGWSGPSASINYKRKGNLAGDLVSLELN